MKKILVVEDNKQFREGANKYLTGRADLQVTYAANYDEAIKGITAEPRLDSMIIDCFFPKETGSRDLTLGYCAIDQLLKVHNDGLPEAYRDEGLNSTIARMLTLFEKSFGMEYARNQAKELRMKEIGLNTTINYWLLEQAMKEDETNQPLGILVGQKAMELGIPFILATSTFHHDELTQPIYEYVLRRGWKLVDCDGDSKYKKEDPRFWERAFGELERIIP